MFANYIYIYIKFANLYIYIYIICKLNFCFFNRNSLIFII